MLLRWLLDKYRTPVIFLLFLLHPVVAPTAFIILFTLFTPTPFLIFIFFFFFSGGPDWVITGDLAAPGTVTPLPDQFFLWLDA